MSIMLYRLGIAIARHRGVVIGAWMLVLGVLLGASMALGDNYDDTFTVPGTSSQEGQDLLLDRFDQSGTSAQLLFTADKGDITDAANAAAARDLAKAVDDVKHVTMSNPLDADDPVISSDRTLDEVLKAGTAVSSSPVTSDVGGDALPLPAYVNAASQLVSGGHVGSLVSVVMVLLAWGLGSGPAAVLVVRRSRVSRVSSPQLSPAV